MAAFCGQPHSESEVYFVKSTTIGRSRSQDAGLLALQRPAPELASGVYIDFALPSPKKGM